MRKVLEVDGDDGCTIMSIYHSSEIYTKKRLRWQVLCVF